MSRQGRSQRSLRGPRLASLAAISAHKASRATNHRKAAHRWSRHRVALAKRSSQLNAAAETTSLRKTRDRLRATETNRERGTGSRRERSPVVRSLPRKNNLRRSRARRNLARRGAVGTSLRGTSGRHQVSEAARAALHLVAIKRASLACSPRIEGNEG